MPTTGAITIRASYFFDLYWCKNNKTYPILIPSSSDFDLLSQSMALHPDTQGTLWVQVKTQKRPMYSQQKAISNTIHFLNLTTWFLWIRCICLSGGDTKGLSTSAMDTHCASEIYFFQTSG